MDPKDQDIQNDERIEPKILVNDIDFEQKEIDKSEVPAAKQ